MRQVSAKSAAAAAAAGLAPAAACPSGWYWPGYEPQTLQKKLRRRRRFATRNALPKSRRAGGGLTINPMCP